MKLWFEAAVICQIFGSDECDIDLQNVIVAMLEESRDKAWNWPIGKALSLNCELGWNKK